MGALVSVVIVVFIMSTNSYAGWDRYKELYVQDDGRVIDKANQSITHSEAIGYTLYFAFKFNDDKTFDKVYQWYKNNMPLNEKGLVPWKWGEKYDGKWGILDFNNASDGDMWIAYALLLMSERRNDSLMLKEAKNLIIAMRENVIFNFYNKNFFLPGGVGFVHDEYIVVNPSYYRFDIFKKFATVDHSKWMDLHNDGIWLLERTKFGSLDLPSDWVSIDKDLIVAPAVNNTFGYDAIRIGLNILDSGIKQEKQDQLLLPWKRYIKMMEVAGIPLGVVSLDKGTIDLYNYGFGHLAIYSKIYYLPFFAEKKQKLMQKRQEDYYAFALYLFSRF